MSLDLRFSKVVTEEKCVGDFNITHNLTEMARAAGIYGVLWRPEENGYKKAGEMLELLERGLADLKAQPDHYKQFNSDKVSDLYKSI